MNFWNVNYWVVDITGKFIGAFYLVHELLAYKLSLGILQFVTFQIFWERISMKNLRCYELQNPFLVRCFRLWLLFVEFCGVTSLSCTTKLYKQNPFEMLKNSKTLTLYPFSQYLNIAKITNPTEIFKKFS